MGGVVSAGHNNDELVDNLCKESYIVSPVVERVFRILDRKDYMTFNEESDYLEAYEDHAWRRGNLHLSAPCIYTKAMERLQLGRGQSFLNIGSGTGYLSTMAGLLLGATGLNHGIEIFPDNVEFAIEKLNKFKEESPWYDPVDFCEPLFIVGNALLLSPSGILYDKVYCGAACPGEHIQLLKNMLRIGGLLVLPSENSLEAISRIGDNEWVHKVILSTVSFAPLILPSASTPDDLTAITIVAEVPSLKELCRLTILSSLQRENYHKISSLPLPIYLQQYVAYNRTWGSAPVPLKTLCPMERKEEEEGEEDKKEEDDNELSWPFPMHGIDVQRVGNQQFFLVNVNGLVFQVPVESDHSDNERENDENDEENM